MKPLRVEFTLSGTTPILFHADDVMAQDVLEEWRKNPSNKSVSRPEPRQE